MRFLLSTEQFLQPSSLLRSTKFHYTLALEPDFPADHLQTVGGLVQSTYNSLSQDYRDPIDQTIGSVQVVQFTPSNNGVVEQN